MDMIIATDTRPEAGFRERLKKQMGVIERLVKGGAVSPFKVLDKINEFVDEALAEPGFMPPKTCQRGCSHCCYIAVGITGFEARYIESRTGHKIKSYMSEQPNIKVKTPCPFLKNNECSIYQHRPMVCRAFMSFDDVKHCIDRTNHHMMKLVEPGQGGFEWMNTLYFNTIMTYLQKHPEYQEFNDIRGFFGETPRGPDA